MSRFPGSVLSLAIVFGCAAVASSGGLYIDHALGARTKRVQTGQAMVQGCFGPIGAASSSSTGKVLLGTVGGAVLDSFVGSFLASKAHGDPLRTFAAFTAFDAYRQVSRRAFARAGLAPPSFELQPVPFLLRPSNDHFPGLWFLSSGGIVGMSARLGQPYVSTATLVAAPVVAAPSSTLLR